MTKEFFSYLPGEYSWNEYFNRWYSPMHGLKTFIWKDEEKGVWCIGDYYSCQIHNPSMSDCPYSAQGIWKSNYTTIHDGDVEVRRKFGNTIMSNYIN